MKHRIGEGGNPVKGKNAAGILFTDGSSMLLLKRAEGSHTGTWGLPGGHSMDGETEIGNAIRETKEETGLSSIPGYRFDEMSSRDGKKKFTVFLYRVGSQFDVDLSEEHTDWDWVDLNSFEDKDLHPKLEENLPRYLRCIRRKIRSFTEWVGLRDSPYTD